MQPADARLLTADRRQVARHYAEPAHCLVRVVRVRDGVLAQRGVLLCAVPAWDRKRVGTLLPRAGLALLLHNALGTGAIPNTYLSTEGMKPSIGAPMICAVSSQLRCIAST